MPFPYGKTHHGRHMFCFCPGLLWIPFIHLIIHHAGDCNMPLAAIQAAGCWTWTNMVSMLPLATVRLSQRHCIMFSMQSLDDSFKFLGKHIGYLLDWLNRLKEQNFCYQREGRSIFAANYMHHLWQQCTIHLPAIDFELEMLVHCIVWDSMQFPWATSPRLI